MALHAFRTVCTNLAECNLFCTKVALPWVKGVDLSNQNSQLSQKSY